MKIWIDISNAPHVNFFQQLITEWQAAGHEIEVTARALSDTLPLLDRAGIEYNVIGGHSGANPLRKLLGFPRRCFQLWLFLRNKSIDVAISQSSYYSPVVARMLGCRSIYTNDNEHAKGNLAGFLLADIVLLPEPLRGWASKRFFRNRVQYYPGVKEGIYIHALAGSGPRPRADDRGRRIVSRRIVFRPEPWTAQYHSADKQSYRVLLENLAQDFSILVLPRGEDQAIFFKALAKTIVNENIHVQETPLSVAEIVGLCDIFIGAGGSMSREFACLGIPMISTYQGALLAVDRYLIDAGSMCHIADISPPAVRAAISRLEKTPPSVDLAESGKIAYQMVRDSINSGESG